MPRGERTLLEELQAWRLVLPHTAAFSHLSAAELYGWWLPAPIEHPVFVAMPTGTCGPRRPGLFVCRHPKPPAVRLIHGFPVTTPAETLLAAARDLGILDLVIMGDSALRQEHCTITELEITAGQHRRGGPLLRQVIPLLDRRSESAWESVMRVLNVAADIPVVPQHEIFDASGRFVARADLWVRNTRRIHEYDGADHRLGGVHAHDLDRDRRLILAGWERFGFTSSQLKHGGRQIILETDRLLGRGWDSRRLDSWNHLIDTSLYGRAGRARAYRQWRRTTTKK